LVTALNTLGIDPGSSWKGVWRWYAEDALACCKPLLEIQQEGINLEQWKCLAECNRASVELVRAADGSEAAFRKEVVRCCGAAAAQAGVLCVSYSRIQFAQSGDGHFSPIGAYDAESDHLLILDVARYRTRLNSPALGPVGPLFGLHLTSVT